MRRIFPFTVAMTIAIAVAVAVIVGGPSEQQLTRWGGAGAIYYYGSMAEWRANATAEGASVAVVRVTAVTDLRWSTASGQRPGQPEVDMVNRGEAGFTIGRLVTAELVRQVDGEWPAVAQTAKFFLPGGQLGADYTAPSELHHHLPTPKVGDIAVATILPASVDLDEGQGILMVDIGAMFPVTRAGLVVTPDHTEAVTLAQLSADQ